MSNLQMHTNSYCFNPHIAFCKRCSSARTRTGVHVNHSSTRLRWQIQERPPHLTHKLRKLPPSGRALRGRPRTHHSTVMLWSRRRSCVLKVQSRGSAAVIRAQGRRGRRESCRRCRLQLWSCVRRAWPTVTAPTLWMFTGGPYLFCGSAKGPPCAERQPVIYLPGTSVNLISGRHAGRIVSCGMLLCFLFEFGPTALRAPHGDPPPEQPNLKEDAAQRKQYRPSSNRLVHVPDAVHVENAKGPTELSGRKGPVGQLHGAHHHQRGN